MKNKTQLMTNTSEVSSTNIDVMPDETILRHKNETEIHRARNGTAGLRNQNVTCYSNAIFQAIASCTHLSTLFGNLLRDDQ